MKHVGQGVVPDNFIDSNFHMNIKHYVGIISDGTHQFVKETDLSIILNGEGKSFVITKMLSFFHKELNTNDEWNLFVGLYKINLAGFSLMYDLKKRNTRAAKFYARCNFFDLSTRKSYQINPEILASLNLEVMTYLHDPLLISNDQTK